MSKINIETGEISKPRFEFRTFGQNFSESAGLMAELSIPVSDHIRNRKSTEIYIVSPKNNINNIKIRSGMLDIKTYVQTVQGLEQWNPLMKVEFPINSIKLKTDIFPFFQFEIPKLTKNEYKESELLEIIDSALDLRAVRVYKERLGFMVNNTICEVANVQINDSKIASISSESTEIKNVLKTLKDVKLNSFENINYLQAIKRTIGMINKPLAN